LRDNNLFILLRQNSTFFNTRTVDSKATNFWIISVKKAAISSKMV